MSQEAAVERKRWQCPHCGKHASIPIAMLQPKRCPHCQESPELTSWECPTCNRRFAGPVQICPDCAVVETVVQAKVIASRNTLVKSTVRVALAAFRGLKAAGWSARHVLLDFFLCSVFLVSLVVWGMNFGSPPSRAVGISYLSLILAGIALCLLLGTRYRSWRALGIGVAITVSALAICVRFDSYVVSWKHEETEYIDSYLRWGPTITHRRVTVPRLLMGEGPMSASGKPHGQWRDIVWKPYEAKDVWYWYGEEITEGEWHLRNRK